MPEARAARCHVLLPAVVFGGHEKMLLEWLHEADAHGLETRVHCRDIPELVRHCRAAGLRADPSAYDSVMPRGRLAGIGRDMCATWRILGDMPADAVALFAPGVVQAQPWHPLLAALRRRRTACYVPMAYASTDMGFRHARMRDCLVGPIVRKVDVWITITEQQERLLRRHWRVSAPVHIVPNRLKLKASLASRREARERGPMRVLFVGRFEPHQKGLDWLSEQLRLHSAAWQGRLAFTFKGAGDFEPRLRALADSFPGEINIADWGDVADELCHADALLLPSRFEGMPLVAIEAVHYGVPVVASDRAGLAGLLPPESVFPFGDFDGMLHALEHLRNPAAACSAVAHTHACMQPQLSKERFDRAIGEVVRDFAARTTDLHRAPAAL